MEKEKIKIEKPAKKGVNISLTDIQHKNLHLQAAKAGMNASTYIVVRLNLNEIL